MFKSKLISAVCAMCVLYTAVSQAEQENLPERQVTLDQVLVHAMQHAPAIAVARAGIEVGNAGVEAASPLLPSDPVVSASAGRRWSNDGAGVDYSAGLRQEFDLAGKRSAWLDAARSGLRARQAELDAVKWSVHQGVHGAYHQALVARDRVASALSVLAFTERLVSVARKRLDAGETSPLPVRLAEGELAGARQAAMLAKSQYTSIRLDLAQVAGWSEPALLTPTGSLELPEAPPPADSLIRIARHKQSARRAAGARVAEARARLAATEKQAWPNLTLGLDYQQEADPGAEPARIVTGSLSVPLPVWVGNGPARARARATLVRARAEQAALETALGIRIVQARQRAHANAARARLFAAEVLPSFEKNLELLRRAFELGEIDILQVLVAQERFLNAQQQALQAFVDYYEAWAELEAAVGAELHPKAHSAGAAE